MGSIPAIRTFKFIGALLYYGALWLFALADRHYGTDGALTAAGYCYGTFFLVFACVASTGQQRLQDLLAEQGGADGSPAGRLWALADRAVFWGAFVFTAYFLLKARPWDALAALGFPAWKLWLRLEIRRLKIKSGEVRPYVFWKIALALSAGSAAVLFLLMLLGFYGPYENFGWGEVQLYPLFLVAAILSALAALIATGGKFD